MKNKNEVYVVVDTPKKSEKLKKVLDMFGENYGDFTFNLIKQKSISEIFFNVYQWNVDCSGCIDRENQSKVSIKELRNILAKEYLKVGDCFVDCNKYIFILNKINEDGTINCSCLTHNTKGDLSYEDFKRYATPEEISLLEPKETDKFAELKEAHKNGAVIQVKGKLTGKWNDIGTPTWNENHEYRIKPEEKPKVGDLVVMYNNSGKFVCIKHLTEFDKLNLEYSPELASYKLADKELVFDLLFNK